MIDQNVHVENQPCVFTDIRFFEKKTKKQSVFMASIIYDLYPQKRCLHLSFFLFNSWKDLFVYFNPSDYQSGPAEQERIRRFWWKSLVDVDPLKAESRGLHLKDLDSTKSITRIAPNWPP